ncbi:hypothetical protein N7532_010197 [Penicillium argentinense]|uniref:Uncharacterized protein n=1 Tax=Penicillium argentinense TaxID=1131581 RepID=A0A9W9JXW5_9EURO|nr:uncharacterized protein N7532_010197 [Penicillium argentinense]KAJ5085426.1 hypothetical protein N7532_010197 [Penicillium argentinense]
MGTPSSEGRIIKGLLFTSREPSSTFNRGPHWYHESPWLPLGHDALSNNALGSRSLKQTALLKTLHDQSLLDPASFKNVPWLLAKEIWDFLGECNKQTLHMWKILATIYPTDFRKGCQFYKLYTLRPVQPLKGYIETMNDRRCNWHAFLSLETAYATVEDLVRIGGMANLAALEIERGQWRPCPVLPLSHPNDPETTLEDGIVRSWLEMARAQGSLQHLRVLRISQQNSLTLSSLDMLAGLPGLALILVHKCRHFTEAWTQGEEDQGQAVFAAHGWHAQSLSKVLERRGLDEFTGPMHFEQLGNAYTDSLRTGKREDGTERLPPGLAGNAPKMDFCLHQGHRTDVSSIEKRMPFASGDVLHLTPVLPGSASKRPVTLSATQAPSRSEKKRPSSSPAKESKDKRIMKSKPLRNLEDLLSEFS